MIYGLYLSATGVQTNSHNQDIISNNLANAETTGFKRSLAVFESRRMEAAARSSMGMGGQDPILDRVGGGQWVAPTAVDYSQGAMESSSNPFDTAVFGKGYLGVAGQDGTKLTRDGQMTIDPEGFLALTNSSGSRVLDVNQQPIDLKSQNRGQLTIGSDGTIRSKTETVAKIGLFDVANTKNLKPAGDNLLAVLGGETLTAATGRLQSGFTEGSNVDPTVELTRLMEAQRLLEANVNMIKYQDATLGKLVNEVGKIG